MVCRSSVKTAELDATVCSIVMEATASRRLESAAFTGASPLSMTWGARASVRGFSSSVARMAGRTEVCRVENEDEFGTGLRLCATKESMTGEVYLTGPCSMIKLTSAPVQTTDQYTHLNQENVLIWTHMRRLAQSCLPAARPQWKIASTSVCTLSASLPTVCKAWISQD